jgi:hypothetical protein
MGSDLNLRELLSVLDERLKILRKRNKDDPNSGTSGRIKEVLWIKNQVKWRARNDKP